VSKKRCKKPGDQCLFQGDAQGGEWKNDEQQSQEEGEDLRRDQQTGHLHADGIGHLVDRHMGIGQALTESGPVQGRKQQHVDAGRRCIKQHDLRSDGPGRVERDQHQGVDQIADTDPAHHNDPIHTALLGQ